ncbi:MAG: ATP-binding cassette domain-containing protein [Bacteroidales bacterium]
MIEIKNLSFGYKKQNPIYSDLNVDLKSGQIVGLLGKNGAGKTTLLKIILGLLQSNVKGSISVMGFDPAKRNPDMLKEVFMISEEIDLPSIKISTYVKSIAGYYERFDHQKLNNILEEFKLEKDFVLTKISYGQKKKFLIALALASGCRLLVLDEPTNGLDIPSKSLFRKIISGALTDDQLVIISTHQVKDIENIIDHILILNEGKVCLHQSLHEISQRFSFYQVSDPSEMEYLYKETIPGGYKLITKCNGVPTDWDLEVLFNASIFTEELMEEKG